MQPASAEGSNSDGGRALRRYGPIAAIGVVALAIVGVIVLASGDDAAAPAPTTEGSSSASVADTSAADTTGTDAPADTEADAATDIATSTGTDTETSTDESAATTDGESAVESPLPDGVMSFSVAEELGLDVDFGERCDAETGRVKVQTFFAPECYRPFEGDNGGATDRGGYFFMLMYLYLQKKTKTKKSTLHHNYLYT